MARIAGYHQKQRKIPSESQRKDAMLKPKFEVLSSIIFGKYISVALSHPVCDKFVTTALGDQYRF